MKNRIFLKDLYHYSEDLMVQPRIARMTRIMVCAFVQIRVIRGCLNCNCPNAGLSGCGILQPKYFK